MYTTICRLFQPLLFWDVALHLPSAGKTPAYQVVFRLI